MSEPTFEELYSLGLPLALLAKRFGLTESACHHRAWRRGIQRPPLSQKKIVARELRLERIRANIKASPSLSMFIWEKAA